MNKIPLTQGKFALVDEDALIDVIAEKQANGWEYGTHPRDKAKIVIEAIRPYLAPKRESDDEKFMTAEPMPHTARASGFDGDSRLGLPQPPDPQVDAMLESLVDCVYYPNPVSPFDAFVAPGKKKQFSEVMDKIQAYLTRFPTNEIEGKKP